jgi:hypothetical protein
MMASLSLLREERPIVFAAHWLRAEAAVRRCSK